MQVVGTRREATGDGFAPVAHWQAPWRRVPGGRVPRVAVAAAVVLVAALLAVALAVHPWSGARRSALSPASGHAAGSGHAASGVARTAVGSAAPPAPAAGTASAAGAASPVGKASGVPALPAGEVGQSAAVVETGSVGLRVGRHGVAPSMGRLAALATGAGGYVASSQTSSGSRSGSGTVTLRVPAASFGTVLAEVQRLGVVTSLSTSATDVTGKVTDLQDQITALEASRTQYLAIMADATTVADILSVQEQLDTIDSQIQQLQGQQQVLDDETTYASLSVSVVAATAPTPPRPVSSSLERAWRTSVHGFLAGVDGLVGVAGPLVFAALLVGLVGLGGRWLWRLRRPRPAA